MDKFIFDKIPLIFDKYTFFVSQTERCVLK